MASSADGSSKSNWPGPEPFVPHGSTNVPWASKIQKVLPQQGTAHTWPAGSTAGDSVQGLGAAGSPVARQSCCRAAPTGTVLPGATIVTTEDCDAAGDEVTAVGWVDAAAADVAWGATEPPGLRPPPQPTTATMVTTARTGSSLNERIGVLLFIMAC